MTEIVVDTMLATVLFLILGGMFWLIIHVCWFYVCGIAAGCERARQQASERQLLWRCTRDEYLTMLKEPVQNLTLAELQTLCGGQGPMSSPPRYTNEGGIHVQEDRA